MIPYDLFHSVIVPLVNPRPQKLVAAQDFVNGEVVGKAYYIVTHGKFIKAFYGTEPIASDYSFSMVTGGDAFSINSSTGIITVSNISNFTSTRTITVRCTFKGVYSEDQDIEIIYVPIANAVYLDPDFVGTSTGSRSQPYIRVRSYPSASRYGKTFFYKSGTTTTLDYLTLTNDASDPLTAFARWGTGEKPVIDITEQGKQNAAFRYMNVGSTSDVPAYNILVCELKFFHDVDDVNASDVYPFQIRPVSRNFEMYNCDFEGNTFRNGFIWCPLLSKTIPLPYDVTNTDRMFSNVTFYDYRFQNSFPSDGGNRALKTEHPARVENCIATTPFTGNVSTAFSAIDMPGFYGKWLYVDSSQAFSNNRGFNIRTGYQQYEGCYYKGANEPIAITNNDNSSGSYRTPGYSGGPAFPVDGTSGFKNCIVEDAGTSGISFFNTEDTSVAPPETTVYLQGIITLNCANGITYGNGVRNVDAVACRFIDSINNGIRQTGGTGNRVLHCIALGSGGNDANVSSGSVEAINCILPTVGTNVNQTTCSTDIDSFVDIINGDYRLVEESPLIGAGTFISGLKDALGYDFLNPPSIGAFEYIEDSPPPPPPPPSNVIRGLRFVPHFM